jgi:hypothetical protein
MTKLNIKTDFYEIKWALKLKEQPLERENPALQT